MTSPTRSLAIQQLLALATLALLPSTAGASPAECAAGDMPCSAHDAEPNPGQALLQRAAKREGTNQDFAHERSPVERHWPERHASMMQNGGFAAEVDRAGLPAGAAALFNKMFCQRRQNTSRPSRANASHSPIYVSVSSGSASGASRKADGDEMAPRGLPHGATAASELGQRRTPPADAQRDGLRTQANGNIGGATGKKKAPRSSPSFTRLTADAQRDGLRTQANGNIGGAAEKKKAPRSSPSFTRSYLDNWDDSEFPSLRASLDEAGFKKVAALNSSEQMKMYVRRLAHSCNLKVINDGGLNGAIAWFNGTEKTGAFNRLKLAMFKALLAPSKDHWVAAKHEFGVSGSSAPLDLVGYVQVRALRNAKHMTTFVRRMLKNMGLRIIDEDGFNGLMRYYNEPDDSQGFEKLMFEIKKAAYEHSWVELA